MSGASVVEQIKSSQVSFRDSFDAVAYFIHVCFLQSGFEFVGFTEDANNNKEQVWNASPDSYCFVYKRNKVFVLKMLRVGGKLMVFLDVKGEKVIQFEVEYDVCSFDCIIMLELVHLLANFQSLQWCQKYIKIRNFCSVLLKPMYF